MSSIDQQFVEFVVKSLVSNPDAVSVVRTIDEKGVLLELTVSPDDLGRVIGKRGATAQSLRTLLRALGTKNEARYNLKIVDNGEPRAERTKSDDSSSGGAWGEEPKSESSEDSNSESSESNVGAETSEEPKSESSYDKTRKELAELDDLEV